MLLVDNCSAHSEDAGEGLTNISVAFLPPNTTSVMQPLDAGLIRALKAHYRRLISQLILNKMDETKESISAMTLARKISLHDGVIMLDQAWREIKDASVRNCWSKCHLIVSPCEEEEDETALAEENGIDSDLPICRPAMDEDIVAEVCEEFGLDLAHEEDNEDEDNEADREVPPSLQETRKAWDTLQRGLFHCGFENFELLRAFNFTVNTTLTKNLI